MEKKMETTIGISREHQGLVFRLARDHKCMRAFVGDVLGYAGTRAYSF